MPGTVTVACKLPNGLRLRVSKMEERQELVMGGGTRTVQMAVRIGEPVIVAGNAHPVHKAPTSQIFGGYALTHGVDADFMALWMKQNAGHPAVVNHLIFVHDKASMVEGKAKEYTKQRSGLEPIDPDNLPKGIQKATDKVAA